jgi:hypothetical protein
VAYAIQLGSKIFRTFLYIKKWTQNAYWYLKKKIVIVKTREEENNMLLKTLANHNNSQCPTSFQYHFFIFEVA